jgi:hypothetical protein
MNDEVGPQVIPYRRHTESRNGVQGAGVACLRDNFGAKTKDLKRAGCKRVAQAHGFGSRTSVMIGSS